MSPRPGFIRHYAELQSAEPWPSPDPASAEKFSLGAALGRRLGLTRIGIHHELLPPGRRTSYPHAHSHEEELVFVLEGMPDGWIDGHLHRMRPGDAAGFPAGTGIAHSFLNSSEADVRLLVVGDATRPEDRCYCPLNPELRSLFNWWDDAPQRPRGSHDGRPGQRPSAPAAPRPDFIRHYSELQGPDDAHYSGSDELLSIGAPLARAFGLNRIGIHHELLPPGRRTSFPHAESAEEEFVYVIEGTPDAWIDGDLHRLRPGDAVGFPAGTGICHSFLNNTAAPARLIVVGEAAKPTNRIYYPLNPERKPLRSDWWEDVPRRPLGPHDGKPKRP